MAEIPRLEYIPQPIKCERNDINHQNVHNCRDCPYTSKSLFFMANHLKSHDSMINEGKFSCSRSVPELFYCLECNYKTFLFINFSRHITQCHKNTGPNNVEKTMLTCFICRDYKFDTYSSYLWEMHVKDFNCSSESHEKKFECHRCLFQTLKKSKFKRHTCLSTFMLDSSSPTSTNVFQMDFKWFKCGHCKYKSKFKNNVSTHISRNHTAAEKIRWFRCPHCNYRAKQKAHISSHILTKHTAPEKIKWFQCFHCDYKSKNKGTLAKHITNKHTAPEKIQWFRCPHCNYKAKQKAHVSNHVISRHTAPEEIRWFECPHCEYKAKQKIHVSLHVFSKHADAGAMEWFK